MIMTIHHSSTLKPLPSFPGNFFHRATTPFEAEAITRDLEETRYVPAAGHPDAQAAWSPPLVSPLYNALQPTRCLYTPCSRSSARQPAGTAAGYWLLQYRRQKLELQQMHVRLCCSPLAIAAMHFVVPPTVLPRIALYGFVYSMHADRLL